MSNLIDKDDAINAFTEWASENLIPHKYETWYAEGVKMFKNLPTHETDSNTLKALDCISRQAAIDSICRAICDTPEICESPCELTHELWQLPSAEPDKDINVPSNDCISRQAAINALSCETPTEIYIYYDDAVKAIRRLPSAEPEKRTNKRTETHECDLISRQAAIMHFVKASKSYECGMFNLKELTHELWQLPSAQSEITDCPMCPDCPDNCPLEVEHEQDG